MLVIGATVLADALTDDGPTATRVRDRLRGESLAAPRLVDLEVISVWGGLTRGGHLNGTMYDAAYVALAEALQVTVLTGDRRLARAPAPNCPIEIITARPSSR